MAAKRSGYIDVDALLPQVTLEQVAEYYNTPLPELTRVGEEIRGRCFLQCGLAEQTGDRALAIKGDDPVKPWHCHQYGCGRGGNLVSLCDLLKPGTHMDGKPRGERFKAIARDLRAMVEGVLASDIDTDSGSAAPRPAPATKEALPQRNVPLAESENEAARALVTLDEKFIVEPERLSPPAARYFRERPFLTPDVCREWRCGYLPRSAGEDRRGGTMRGRIVYGLCDEQGQVLTWFGRDPEFERKHAEWVAGGRRGREPVKTAFVKGFHRGLELFGQERLRDNAEYLKETGLLVVEGPNDVIRLATLGIPSIGLCSNQLTAGQAEKIERLAREHGEGRVHLMLDADMEGDRGAKEALWQLSQRDLAVRLVWSREMYGGRYRDRQPESLNDEEWAEVALPLQV